MKKALPGPKVQKLAPLNLKARLLNQISQVLTELEGDPDCTWPQRMQAINIVGRLILAYEGKDEENDAGATVRKYAASFQAKNAASGGKAPARVLATNREYLALDPDDPDPAA
jgi:hypothetical protein